MGPRSSPVVRAACLVIGVIVIGQRPLINFSSVRSVRRPTRVARATYESGKVNMGVEIGDPKTLPPPYLEANEATSVAIQDCLEEGCSVEALMALDTTLARDEQRVTEAMENTKVAQKTAFSEDSAESLVWYDNILKRMGALRAQLQALQGKHEDTDFVKQIIKAAGVSFGGARPNDYPKVGVSSYSS